MNDENLTFVSASNFGSYMASSSVNATAHRVWGATYEDKANSGFVPTNFVGINANIQEAVSSSFNTLGYPASVPVILQAQQGAVSFVSGSDQYFDAGNQTAFSFGNGSQDSVFSVNFWIKCDDLTSGAYQYIAAKSEQSPSNYEYEIYIQNSPAGTLKVRLYDDSAGSYIQAYTTNSLSAYEGEFFHVTITYNANESASGIKIYINGVSVSTTGASSGTYTAMEVTDAKLNLARGRENNSNEFQGKLANFMLWSRELSADDALSLYNNGCPTLANNGVGISNTGLVAWDKLDDLSGADSSGNNYNGSFPNSATVSNRMVSFDCYSPHTSSYINSAFIQRAADPNSPSYIEGGQVLNALILHRQGPYGWPSWKQVRVGNHPVNRVHRKNNIFSYVEKSSLQSTGYIFSYGTPPFPFVFAEDPVGFNLTESCVSSKHRPIQHSFVVKQNGELVNLNLKHSYGNLEEHYTNEKINIRLKFNGDFPEQFTKIYDDLKEIYIDKKFTYDFDDVAQNFAEALTEEEEKENPYGMDVPFKKWVNMTYTECVFPKQQNTFLAKARKRTQYAEVSGLGSNGYDRRDFRTFWKDDLNDRAIRTNTVSLNSQGFPTAFVQSLWSLDTGGTEPFHAAVLNKNSSSFGELLVARTPLKGPGGPMAAGGFYDTTASLSLYRFQGGGTPTPPDRFLYGIPLYATDQISGKKPFFNSYEDFAEDIRGIGKDYSILPEFRISDHMDYYVRQKEGNFLARNDAFLSMIGGNITSSADQEESTTGGRNTINVPSTRPPGIDENFFIEYSHSDFLKYFQKVADDHQEEGEVKSYTFSMKGIKKLLPYKGFYPHQRTLQLGTILSQSYGSVLSGSHVRDASMVPPQATETAILNSFLRPLAAPGIMFNSIKSSLAVDYPVFTGSVGITVSTDSTFSLKYISSAPNFRLPFETIIQPDTYIPTVKKAELDAGTFIQKSIIMDEPIGGAGTLFSFAKTGLGAPLYSLAANNFFGEIPRFFLKDEKFTDFISKPQGQFKSVEAGKSYYMDVVVRKTSDMVLSEGQALLGAGDYNFSQTKGAYYGPPLSSSVAGNVGSNVRDPAYAPYTPPYFYEDSIARIKYTPTTSGQPTLSDILSNSEINTEYTGSSVILGFNDIASKAKMTISASVNLFGRSRYKKVNYSTNIGPDGNYIPTSIEDTDAFSFDAWSIGTKFECPALNFSASTDFHSASTGKGLWAGYGSLPTGSTGLWLELKESFAFRSSVSDVDATLTGSLIDICGFQTNQKRIGRPAHKKVISEAIIAIPFTYETHKPGNATTLKYPETDKRFFRIPIGTYNQALKQSQEGVPPEEAVLGAGQTSAESIVNMINKMQKYNLPPQFDFLTFPDLKPFVMYIFEFEHSLTQQDLTDIWQGLMPEISRTAQEDEVIVSHKAGHTEFFGGKRLPNTTRWMLFKVKRKAEKSYFAVTADAEDDQRFKFKFGNEEKAPEYSYNWPYDFFSLVELAKMEVDIEFGPKKKAFED